MKEIKLSTDISISETIIVSLEDIEDGDIFEAANLTSRAPRTYMRHKLELYTWCNGCKDFHSHSYISNFFLFTPGQYDAERRTKVKLFISGIAEEKLKAKEKLQTNSSAEGAGWG